MPKVLPGLNSNAPAKICINPPNASASGITTRSPPAGSTPAFTRLRRTVVSPKATSPSPAGLAAGITDTDSSVIHLPLHTFQRRSCHGNDVPTDLLIAFLERDLGTEERVAVRHLISRNIN